MAVVLGDEKWFCSRVAKTNKLELLKWAREEKKCKWDEGTINAAAEQGNLEMVKYCVANECPINRVGVCRCCRKRSSRVPQILTRRSQSALGLTTAIGRLKMVISTYSNILLSVSMINIRVCVLVAAENGHLDCLKYLHETAKAPWDSWGVVWARKKQPLRMFTIHSAVVSSSRGCCEKTEKKTPPLSGGALIRADRERVLVRGL